MTAQKRKSTIKGSSINREIATLRKALRLAKDWRLVQWLPKFPRLPGEQGREFVVDYDGEKAYLETAQYPLREVAILILEMGMRPNEVVNLKKEDVSLEPAQDSEMGFVRVVTGKTKNAARVLSMTVTAPLTGTALVERMWMSRWNASFSCRQAGATTRSTMISFLMLYSSGNMSMGMCIAAA